MKISSIQNAAATGAVKIAAGGNAGGRRRAELVIAQNVVRRGAAVNRAGGRPGAPVVRDWPRGSGGLAILGAGPGAGAAIDTGRVGPYGLIPKPPMGD